MNRKYKKILQEEMLGLYSNSFSTVAQLILALVSPSNINFERNYIHKYILSFIFIVMGDSAVQSRHLLDNTAATQPNLLHNSLLLLAAHCSKIKSTYVCILSTYVGILCYDMGYLSHIICGLHMVSTIGHRQVCFCSL